MIGIERSRISENMLLSENHWVMRLKCPRIAKKAKPGQFIQVRTVSNFDPLLARPFSFLRTGPDWIEILYQVVGRGTSVLAGLSKGDEVDVLGPLGNGWQNADKACDRSGIILIGGGVGIPPLYHLAESLIRKKPSRRQNITVILGARTKEWLHAYKDFKKLGVSLFCATDDGSFGQKGVVTDILVKKIKKDRTVYTCGPTPMLKAVAKVCRSVAVECQLSVEEMMPCGFGACLGCVVPVGCEDNHPMGQNGERLALSCSEGPVFDSDKLLWERL